MPDNKETNDIRQDISELIGLFGEIVPEMQKESADLQVKIAELEQKLATAEQTAQDNKVSCEKLQSGLARLEKAGLISLNEKEAALKGDMSALNSLMEKVAEEKELVVTEVGKTVTKEAKSTAKFTERNSASDALWKDRFYRRK